MKAKSLGNILIVAIIVALASLLIYGMFRFLSLLLSWPLACLFLFLCFWLIARLVLKVSIFPGSIWLWRRWIEAHFCKEVSTQLMLKTKDIETSLLLILDKLSDYERQDFSTRAVEGPYNAKKMIQSNIENFLALKQSNGLTSSQNSAMVLLVDLQVTLQETQLVLTDGKTASFWDWVDQVQESHEWNDIIFEDFPYNYAARAALNSCDKLIRRLYDSCGDIGRTKGMLRWCLDTSFGTLSQMRWDLEAKFNIENLLLEMSDNTKIDCIWIHGEDETAPAVLMMNPNAGFFEFAYYQNDWIDFYLNRGINIMMFNYRGYGKSQGRPRPAVLKSDSEEIADYLLNVKRVRAFGVHGESLGGMLAVHLGCRRPVRYLYADRTFSGLGDVTKHNFGRLVYWFFSLISRWDSDCALDYINSNCYKVLAADPSDSMISDFASLKAGVSLRMIDKTDLSQLDTYLVSTQVFEGFYNSLEVLMTYIMTYDKHQDTIEHNGVDHTNMQYHAISKRVDTFEEEAVNNILYNVFNILESIDAGGKLLSSIHSDKDKESALKVWILVIDTWGSYFPLEVGVDPFIKSVRQLNHASQQLAYLFDTNSFNSNQNVKIILTNVQIMQHSLMSLANSLDNHRNRNRNRIGNLIPLTCGHSGYYNVNEKALADWHLHKSGFNTF